MNLSLRWITRALALVTALALLMPMAVVADDITPDGDGATPVALNNLQFGTVCVGQTTQRTIPIGIQRGWGGTDPNDPLRVFNAGATVTIAVTGTSNTALSAVMGADATVVLPANWLDTTAWPSGSVFQSDTASATVSLTPTATGTPATQTVSFRASGPNVNNVTINRTVNVLRVNWTAVNCDSTPPVITPSVVGTLGSDGWYTSNVQVSWSVVDSESTVSSTSGCSSTTISADTSGTTLTCTATSAGGTNSVSVTIKRDATNPSVELVGGPADGVDYTLGSVPAAPTCTASDATSGLAGPCAVTGYSTALGSHTVTASATDNAGNQGSDSHSYSVIYNFTGFFQPIANDALNSVKAGQAIPVKFSLGGDQGLNIFAAGFPKSQKVTCDTSGGIDPVEETVTAGQSGLSYDSATDTYVYVWKTEKAWAGSCRQLTVQLADGESYTALFKLNK